MTVAKNSGGSAYPEQVGYGNKTPQPGMTMRQYYKGQAMIGLILKCQEAGDAAGHAVPIAEDAGKLADAAIKEDQDAK